jgi:pimeloyl-ACP methyl ester carboxylesterase
MVAADRGSVVSADGTHIEFRRLGSGPAVILVHGGMGASQNLANLAAALSDEFELIVPDRRGRGRSGPHGKNYGIAREAEDLSALVADTGATRIFGLSSGAIATLEAARRNPALAKVALYEPPLSARGSVPLEWVPRFDAEIAAGRTSSALITALKGMRADPVMSRLPRFLLRPLFALAPTSKTADADDIPIRDLVPTMHYDTELVRETADTTASYATIGADVLLLGGSKSPAYLGTALDALEHVLPHSRRVTLPGLGHTGPEDQPERVAELLRPFFR